MTALKHYLRWGSSGINMYRAWGSGLKRFKSCLSRWGTDVY